MPGSNDSFNDEWVKESPEDQLKRYRTIVKNLRNKNRALDKALHIYEKREHERLHYCTLNKSVQNAWEQYRIVLKLAKDS